MKEFRIVILSIVAIVATIRYCTVTDKTEKSMAVYTMVDNFYGRFFDS